jgi:microcystin-dependent protein
MATYFIGQISLYGFNFPPRGSAQCSGQLLPIQQNAALFSLLGTQYGGNGTTNFALPDLRGRASVGYGASGFSIGQVAGTENVTLLSTNLPAHSHQVNGSTAAGDNRIPLGRVLGASATPIYAAATPNVTLNAQSIAPAGGNQPHPNMQPYSVVNFCIALSGIFPSRN